MPDKLEVIAHIHNDFSEKFGIPRQSGIAQIPSTIVFEPEFRVAEAFRGIEGYSHLWLIWQFSEAVRDKWSPTVRPPRLGGNTRMGVFATRSPFRPNSIGLSSVKLTGVELHSAKGPVLYVEGADLLNGTPIYDIKPYLAYTDAHPEALGGFALTSKDDILNVTIPDDAAQALSPKMLEQIKAILSQDPRPQYQNDADKIYSMSFGGYDISFTVKSTNLTVASIKKL